MARRGKPGISKATGYGIQIFNVVYDMRGAMEYYGVDFMRWLLVQIEAQVEIISVDHALELWYEYQIETDLEEVA